VYDNGKPVRQNVWVDAKANNSFTFPSSKSPDLVNINADGILLSAITETKTPEQYLLQYQGSKNSTAVTKLFRKLLKVQIRTTLL
jgi:aminopeptidase N